ncbi:MAG: apurinic endonuclease APN1 [Candidatus Berkelbacteria bacterium Licking1014_96]|uniref:Probable endonuclease 4 n=1 Tax=Candidatus Berkelbacteria bacterium Licking1014_96 TaxID=2017149 RepID=A0A554LDP0_9BACT|nr:MAG: apurinic endonuclease APN1 [Candidatus Berkelbacteria bacterium Licking1014_96]
MKRIFGVHLSLNQNLEGIVERAGELRIQTFQIFGGNPRQWRSTLFNPKNILQFQRSRKKYEIANFFLHSIYLINLASKNEYIYQNSINSLVDFMQKAELLGADGVITHIGSAREHEDGESACKRVAGAINEILKKTESVKLILENTAWGEGELGSSLEGLAGIYKLVKNKKRVGFCLDTAHLFESGYNIKTKSGLDKFLRSFDRIIGLDKIKILHLNDSKTKLNSKHDRHEVIGEGELGLEAFKNIINHPKLASLPMILETPDLKNEGEIYSLDKARELAEN